MTNQDVKTLMMQYKDVVNELKHTGGLKINESE